MLTSYLKIGAQALEILVAGANADYWNGESTGFSDSEYEAMCHRLRTLLPESSALIEVGHAPREGAHIVDHAVPMMSLRKATTMDALAKWAKTTSETDIYVTPKVDGVACRMVFDEEGELQFAATRGNGKKGELITRAVRAAACVPSSMMANVELRGELYINRGDFERLNADGEFSCARNLVAGYLKRKHPADNFPLRFYPYDVLVDGEPMVDENTKFELYDRIGLVVWVDIMETHDFFETLVIRIETHDRPKWPYETDGLVFRVGTQSEFWALGKTGHHPKGAIAFKYDDETAVTVVRELTWDVSRSGLITPVANFDPVNLAGASISRATLHHWGRLLALKLRKGSTIRVSRRGAVIPHVEDVVSLGDGPKFDKVTQCPSCDGPAWATPGEVSGVVTLACHVPDECPGVLKERIMYFAATVGIKGLGPRMAEDLMAQGRLESLTSLYELTPRNDDPKTVHNLYNEVNRARNLDPAVFLAALGIPHLGTETALVISRKIAVSKIIFSMTMRDIEDMPGIGVITAAEIVNQFQKRRIEIMSVARCIHLKILKRKVKGGKYPNTVFAGAAVLFTGPLTAMNRDMAEERVRKLGGHIAKSATRTLDILVSTTPDSSKTRKAEEWLSKGSIIRIMSETDFIRALVP